jgi:ribonucleoside-diphosphate reductase alpha chain
MVEQERGVDLHLDIPKIVATTIANLYDGIPVSEVLPCAADSCAYITDDTDYPAFAGSLLMAHHASTNARTFGEYLEFAFRHRSTRGTTPLVSQSFYDTCTAHRADIEAHLVPRRDLLFDYFGARTLLKGGYLLSAGVSDGTQTRMVPFETPQQMWMRVAFGINPDDPAAAFELYDILSRKQAIHATPTLFNAGTAIPQLSSCFLMGVQEDSIEGIYDTLKQCAIISKYAGGIGISVDNVRSRGSYIASTNGVSNGVAPMLKVFNATARYCDQGGGKRKGSFAIYMSPHHADLLDWLDLRRPTGSTDSRSRDLFYGLWVSDLFMRRVYAEFSRDQETEPPVLWSLFDPAVSGGLRDSHGDEFTRRYEALEAEGRFVRQVPIRDLWVKILDTQIETGTPYIMFKDHCNHKSNQKNLGTIQGSNLCAEIVEYSDPGEVAVCNLGSISLPSCVVGGTFDYAELARVARVMVRNLDRVIDRTFYPVPEAGVSNRRHRPIGLGIQGLANVFSDLGLAFGSPESRVINRRIAETIYYAAVVESHALAVEKGAYPSIDEGGGAPIRHGIFQQDLWDAPPAPDPLLAYDWEGLRGRVRRDGVRNSLLVAHMPTASTSQILGNTESFEPFYSNMFARKTKAGEFFCYNRALVRDLQACGLWGRPCNGVDVLHDLVRHQGSVQNIQYIPQHIRDAHLTLLDIPLDTLTQMARDRAVYVDQSASLNVHHRNGDNMMVPMTEYICTAWKLGLKTACYYTRTIQAVDAIDFTGGGADVCTVCSA